MSGLDEEALATAVRDEELVVIAGRATTVAQRSVALKELIRRESPLVRPVVAELIGDREAPIELRTTAAAWLGDEASAGNQALLTAALGSPEVALVRVAAKGLGRIGDGAAAEALRQVRISDGRFLSEVAFARALISYRLGIGVARLKPPPPAEVLAVDRKAATPLSFESVAPEAVRDARPHLRHQLPAISLAGAGSVRLCCRTERLWVVLTNQVVGTRAASTFVRREHVAAVVLKESSCPEGWYVVEYLLTQPRGTNRAALLGVRPSGAVVHFGSIETDGPNATVKLRTLNTPLAIAIEVDAHFHGPEGVLDIRAGLSAITSQPGQRKPAAPGRGWRAQPRPTDRPRS